MKPGRHVVPIIMLSSLICAMGFARSGFGQQRTQLGEQLETQDIGTVECDSRSASVKVISTSGDHVAQVDFFLSGGHFDPTPLLSTTVNVRGPQQSCLVANFSVMASPQDNDEMFQVRVDGVPMNGHEPGYTHQPGNTFFPTPVVVVQGETDARQEKMASYTFHAKVRPGVHRVDVLFAGCCSVDPGIRSGLVRSAVLTLFYW